MDANGREKHKVGRPGLDRLVKAVLRGLVVDEPGVLLSPRSARQARDEDVDVVVGERGVHGCRVRHVTELHLGAPEPFRRLLLALRASDAALLPGQNDRVVAPADELLHHRSSYVARSPRHHDRDVLGLLGSVVGLLGAPGLAAHAERSLSPPLRPEGRAGASSEGGGRRHGVDRGLGSPGDPSDPPRCWESRGEGLRRAQSLLTKNLAIHRARSSKVGGRGVAWRALDDSGGLRSRCGGGGLPSLQLDRRRLRVSRLPNQIASEILRGASER